MPNVRKEVAVSAVGSGQATPIYRPRYGQRVHRVSLKRLITADAATTSTWSVGDGSGAAALLSATACLGSSGDLVDGVVGGKLYGAIDTISVTYTPGATPGATAPRCAVMIETEQVWPQ